MLNVKCEDDSALICDVKIRLITAVCVHRGVLPVRRSSQKTAL